MTSKLWIFRDIDPDRQAALTRALSISPATAALLLARGVTTPDEATAWMAPLRAHDPFLIPDIEAAIDRLHYAVRHRERVCFYGDYDVDGMSATPDQIAWVVTAYAVAAAIGTAPTAWRACCRCSRCWSGAPKASARASA